MTIEKFRHEQIAEVKFLLDVCFGSGAWSVEAIRSQLEKPDSRCTVAIDNDAVVGFLAFEQIADEGSVVELAVHPDYRRQGVARALLCSAVENSSSKEIFLEVRESNIAAISLYESLGFMRVGVRKSYYDHPKEDAVLYQKKSDS